MAREHMSESTEGPETNQPQGIETPGDRQRAASASLDRAAGVSSQIGGPLGEEERRRIAEDYIEEQIGRVQGSPQEGVAPAITLQEQERLQRRNLLRQLGAERIDLPESSFPVDPEEGELEEIIVDMGYGARRIRWPKDEIKKLYRMRKVFDQLESYEEGSDAPGLGPRYREVEAVVTALLLSPDENRRKQGETLRKEEKARIALHTGFMGFKLANSIDDIRKALMNTIWAPHITWAMQQGIIVEALQYLEDNAEKYIEATQSHPERVEGEDELQSPAKLPPAKLKEFKDKAVEELGTLTQVEGEISPEAAMRIAERIWQFTGRMALHDRLIVKPDGHWDFLGDAKGGAFQMRKLLKFNEWLFTQYGEHWFPELLSDVNLETPDWFEWDANIFERDEYKTSPDASLFTTKKEDWWKSLSGSDNVPGERVHRKVEGNLERKTNKINFRAINWKKVNFVDIGERPFDFWTYRKLSQPEEARSELSKDDGLLKSAAPDALFKFRDKLSYLSDRHWTNNEHLLINLIDFMEKSNLKKMGRGNIKFDQKDLLIEEAVSHGFIKKAQAQHIEELVLGWQRWPRRVNSIFDIFKFFSGVFIKAIQNALKFQI